jgi:hypothetical protein
MQSWLVWGFLYWAAKELTEKGLKVLVLDVVVTLHVEDYKQHNPDREFPASGTPNQRSGRRMGGSSYRLRAQEHRHYCSRRILRILTKKKRFDWIRGYHTGAH